MSARLLQRHEQGLPEEHDRRYFAELIVELERRLDVNAMRAGTLRLWPLMRWQLARGVKAVQSDSAVARRNKVRSRYARVQRQAYGWRARVARLLGRGRGEAPMERVLRQDIDRQFARLSNAGPLDYVVAAKGEMYFQEIDGRRYSPMTDPVYEDLSRLGRAAPLALEPLDGECVHPPLRLDIEPHLWRMRGTPKPELPEVRASVAKVNAVLAELAPRYHLDADRVIDTYVGCVRRELFFRRVMEVLRPKAVFFSSFTGWAPLTWACRNLGVTTVDIQHGGQSPYHYLTTHWTKVPPEGYEFLPDYFWCWSETNVRFIEPWLPGGARRHVALVGGNRNVAKWKRDGDSLLSTEDRAAIAQLRARDKVILVTLGYSVHDILPPALLEAAARQPDWAWLFRLHPLHRGRTVVEQLEALLAGAGIRGAQVRMPTRVPMHALFSIAHHHVTPFSTAGREALAFGVPTLIVDPIGGTYFADEIGSGIFHYADTAEGILTRLAASSRLPAPDTRYVESDDALVDALLRRVRGDSAR